MGEREWSDAVLMVNGQPVRVLPEVDFGGDTPDEPVARGISSIEFSARITGEAMLRTANLISPIRARIRAVRRGTPPMGSRMPFPLAGGETAFANPPQTAADALATTTETTNQKQSKTMKVKIKGISELESAKYVFDNSGNLIGVRLDVDSERGIRKVYPMALVEEIFD